MLRQLSLTALIVPLLLVARGAAAQDREAALSDQQRQELAALVAEFRRAGTQQQKRLDAIDRMADLGPVGLAGLLEVINQELRPRLGDYRELFGKAAAAQLAQRTEPADPEEIARLRAQVLALSQDEALTKEQIAEVGDPGLAQLKKLIAPSPRAVLAKHPELVQRRQSLGPLGRQWERCTMLLLAALFEEDQKREAAEEKPPPAAVDAFVQGEAQAEQQADEPAGFGPPSFAAYLAKEEELAAVLAAPLDPAARAVLAFNGHLAGRLDPEEARCVLDLNVTRILLGLPAVKIDLALASAARGHSQDMASQGFFSHESPVPGKADPADRAKLAGTTASAENIAMGMLDGAAVNQMWWHSPGHHKNLLGEHTRVGVGRHGRYWTELFGR